MSNRAEPTLLRRRWFVPALFGAAAVLWKVPFVFRYDMNFQTEGGVYYLMAKHILKGEFPTYMWESDYNGTLPQGVVAAFFAVFGPSIPLAAFVSALTYAAAVALGVAYVQRCFGKRAAIAAGIFAAVGVPYGLKYTTVPSGSGYDFSLIVPFLFLWLAAAIYQRGWNFWRTLAAGLLAGHCWYMSKQVLLSFAAIGVVFLADIQGRRLLKALFTTRWLAVSTGAFIVGYFPEIAYKFTHEPKHNLLGIATPEQMWTSLYWLCRVLPAYFDGDPLSRQPEGVHYLQHHYSENFPQTAADFLGIFVAWIVVAFILTRLTKAWRERNVPVLLLATYPILNAFAVIFSRVAAGEYYAPKRYLYTSGIFFLLWAGIKLADVWGKRQWAMAGFLALLVPMSVFHQLQMRELPDELRDYRTLVSRLEQAGHHYGVTFYSYAFALTSLSDERLIFGVLDYNQHPSYEKIVAGQNELVLVFPTGRLNPPETAAFYNHPFQRVGAPETVGELSWVLYRR
jgi:hypothetical protein